MNIALEAEPVKTLMSVYIDDMYKYELGQFRGLRMSHMIADADVELDRLADIIGLSRRWRHGDHYDVHLAMRDKAIAAGAIPVPLKTLAAMVALRRRGLELGAPQTARARLRAFKGQFIGQLKTQED